MTARRSVIEACGLCDEYGWIHDLGPKVPVVRCTYDPATGGW